jgi:hypothetical protein
MEMNEDRFSHLFDLASGNLEEPETTLSDSERQEVRRIRALLDAIDIAWETTPSELDEIRARFLEKLAVREPDHPWVSQSTVRTLGDLVRASAEDLPSLPTEVYAGLLRDATPLEDLMNPVQRTRMVGQAVRSAQMPQELVREFMLWVNRTMTALFPLRGASQPRYVFTRKQGGKRGSR